MKKALVIFLHPSLPHSPSLLDWRSWRPRKLWQSSAICWLPPITTAKLVCKDFWAKKTTGRVGVEKRMSLPLFEERERVRETRRGQREAGVRELFLSWRWC
jgi:hypothetical protein